MSEYVDVPTRTGMAGAIDKAVLISAIADGMAQDCEFDDFVRRTTAKYSGNDASDQATAWCNYCETLRYVREDGEAFRSWRSVVGLPSEDFPVPTAATAGGDCDDLTIILVAGLRTMAIPAMPEILCDEFGDGFHVRARVPKRLNVRIGLPAYSPSEWAVKDPVWESERQWAMADVDLEQCQLLAGEVRTEARFIPIAVPSAMPNWWALATVGVTGWLIGRWSNRRK